MVYKSKEREVFTKCRKNKFWDSEKENLIDLYENKKTTIQKISELYGVWPKTISCQMKRLGIKTEKPSGANRKNAKYSVNTRVFDKVDTEGKAWLLGYIISDGHVSANGKLMFGMASEDEDIARKIAKILETDAPIVKKGKYSQLVVCSKAITDSLFLMGLSNRKTYGFDFDKLLTFVPDELINHFVRGLFDGDGSLRIYSYEYFKKHTYHFGYTGLPYVCDFVKNFFNISTKVVDEGNGIYTCVSSNHSAILAGCEKMYKNATFYCDRKYDTYLRMKDLCKAEY